MDIFEPIEPMFATVDFEPNDTRATAAALTEGEYDIQSDAVDWFVFDLAQGNASFLMKATGDFNPNAASPRDLAMVLYNSAGQAVAADFESGATEDFDYFVASAGTYYLRITTAQFVENTPPYTVEMDYTLSLEFPDAGATDGNETRATATTLTEGTHTINGTAVDWFRVNSVSGVINVDMTTQSGSVPQDLNIILYNSAGQAVSASQGATGTESISYVAPSAGDYFLKVFWAGSPNATSGGIELNYTLDIDLPEEEVRGPNNPGETRATATPLTSGTQNVTGSGVDWFRIDTGPGEMNFAMTSTGTDSNTSVAELNMVLYDANGAQVQANNITGGTERISWLANETGTYYLQVTAPAYPNGETPNGIAMRYRLVTDLPENTWSVPLDFGPVRGASVAAYDIDNDGKDEIFIGTSKALDDDNNEVRPAGLIVLEDDGTVKWTKTFDAIDGPDSKTGKTYNTTSVSTQAVFSDVNGDGQIDILVGVGADNAEEDIPGQPGDKGGLYALDANGNELWYYQTQDVFGSALDQDNDGPDGRPDGVYGTPRVFDIDADGKREVLFTSWDHRLYIVDGATGSLEREYNLHDTVSTTPGVADLDGDGLFEIIVPADISVNVEAGIDFKGGVLNVLSNYAQPNVEGWTDQFQRTTAAEFRGKYIDQPLWSNPKIADIDRDGQLEIIHGTSNLSNGGLGQAIYVWNADGTMQSELATNGQTLAAPLLADLDGDGDQEIIAATTNGYVYAWNANGSLVFETQPLPHATPPLSGDARNLPIARQPVAVDIDADGDLELIVTMASQAIVLDSDGTQLTSLDRADQVFNTYAGSQLVKDIDGDGKLDFISGGTTDGHDQAVIYRWENPVDNVTSDAYRTAEYQNGQSLNQIRDFVERFYETILGRNSDPAGSNGWVDNLYSGVLSGENIARGFINSAEFQNRGTTDAEYVNTLYAAFFDRPADTGGFNAWMTELASGTSRADVLGGFTGSLEFRNLSESFGIRPELAYGEYSSTPLIVGDAADTSLLRGGNGNQVISDEGATVTDDGNREDIIETGQVFRLYGATLGRLPDPDGLMDWVDRLKVDGAELVNIIPGFLRGQEFENRYGANPTDTQFVELLYQNVLGRAPDAGGRAAWEARLDSGSSRAEVVRGFSESAEYRNRTDGELDEYMRNAKVEWNDVIEGGAGNDQMNGGLGSDLYIFRNGQGGNDTIHGFEPWDQLQLTGFGFKTGADALARMSQVGEDVVFNHSGQRIVFTGLTMAEMERVRYNV